MYTRDPLTAKPLTAKGGKNKVIWAKSTRRLWVDERAELSLILSVEMNRKKFKFSTMLACIALCDGNVIS